MCFSCPNQVLLLAPVSKHLASGAEVPTGFQWLRQQRHIGLTHQQGQTLRITT
jgi:hypothetical protein